MLKTVKGLIIDQDHKNAENIKLIMEDMTDNLKLEIIEEEGDGLTLIDCRDYDFILKSDVPAMKHVLDEKLTPYIRKFADNKSNYIKIRKKKEVMYIDVNSIVAIEVMGKNCYVHTVKDQFVITRITLGHLVEMIGDPCIIRCHKSFAVNVKYIRNFVKECRDRWLPVLIVDITLDCLISDIYIESVLKCYEDYHCRGVSKTIEIVG